MAAAALRGEALAVTVTGASARYGWRQQHALALERTDAGSGRLREDQGQHHDGHQLTSSGSSNGSRGMPSSTASMGRSSSALDRL